ncbi:MAG: hypothetical protein H6R09_1532, partial [Proteobacteria bacterium]|nr:hypothetical protein [Pseudomonadota bacterium]
MRGGDKARFERRRRKIETALQHGVEKAVEGFLVALHDLGKARRRLGSEIQAEHAADRIGAEGDAGVLGGCRQADDQPLGAGGELRIKPRFADGLDFGVEEDVEPQFVFGGEFVVHLENLVSSTK